MNENELFFSLFPFFREKSIGEMAVREKKCMKNYTKIREIVENFTVPLAFLRKGGILRMYSDADFPVFIVFSDMH